MENTRAKIMIDYFHADDMCNARTLLNDDGLTIRLVVAQKPFLIMISGDSQDVDTHTVWDRDEIEKQIEKLLSEEKSPAIDLYRKIQGDDSPKRERDTGGKAEVKEEE